MLTKRLIGVRDYSIYEDGQLIGRLRYTEERSPGVWLWHVTVPIPGAPFGSAAIYSAGRAAFAIAWAEFKDKTGPENLAKVYASMNAADRPDRYRPAYSRREAVRSA